MSRETAPLIRTPTPICPQSEIKGDNENSEKYQKDYLEPLHFYASNFLEFGTRKLYIPERFTILISHNDQI
jgi:hypothetical protein